MMSDDLSPALTDSLDRTQAAAYLGLSRATLATWAANGTHSEILRPFRIGRRVRYQRAALDAFIASRIDRPLNHPE